MERFLEITKDLKDSHLEIAEGLESLETIISTKSKKGFIKKEASFEIHFLSKILTEKLNKQQELYRKFGEEAQNLKFK